MPFEDFHLGGIVSLDRAGSAFGCAACLVTLLEQPGADLVVVLGRVDEGDEKLVVVILGKMHLRTTGRSGCNRQLDQPFEVLPGGLKIAGVEKQASLELEELRRNAL